MAWRYSGRAKTNATAPEAYASCDRCGLWYQHRDLIWQFDFRGPRLQNLRILVCTRTCADIPQDQLRPISLPPDPTPIFNARPEPFATDNQGVSISQSTTPPVFGPGTSAQAERATVPSVNGVAVPED